MKLLLISVFVMSQIYAKDLAVYVMAGQSNMVGVGILDDLPGVASELLPNKLPSNVKIVSSVNGEVHLQESPLTARSIPVTNTYQCQYPSHPVSSSVEPYFGPELSFGKEIATIHPNDDILLIKYAAGGRPICISAELSSDVDPAKAFLPRSSIGGPGWLYSDLINGDANIGTTWIGAKNIIQNARASGKYTSVKVKGFLWMQGESDALSIDCANSYGTNLKNFISDIRSDLGSPDLPFVIGKISSSWTYPSIVRSAQEEAKKIKNVTTIETEDLMRYNSYDDMYCVYSPNESGAHYRSDAIVAMGYRFAWALKKGVQNKSSVLLMSP